MAENLEINSGHSAVLLRSLSLYLSSNRICMAHHIEAMKKHRRYVHMKLYDLCLYSTPMNVLLPVSMFAVSVSPCISFIFVCLSLSCRLAGIWYLVSCSTQHRELQVFFVLVVASSRSGNGYMSSFFCEVVESHHSTR